jgi:hypothetical protein
MAGIITLLDQPRTSDASALPTTAIIYFYQVGTTTLQNIYTDSALTTLAANPVVLAAGQMFPIIYLNPALTYRRRIVYGDATVQDVDPLPVSGKEAADNLATLLNSSAGASNVKTTDGSTVQASLSNLSSLVTSSGGLNAFIDALARSVAVEKKNKLPYVDVNGVAVGDLIPTAVTPVAALRLHQDWILVRTRTTSLAGSSPSGVYFDEYILRDPRGFSGVDGGWQTIAHRAFAADRYFEWVVTADNPGDIANNDFALRFGLYTSLYHSGGEGPYYYYSGFGHGRMFADRNLITITSDGRAGNLQTIANWPVGTRVYGTYLTVTSTFRCRTLAGLLGSSPIATTNASTTATITHTAHGYSTGQGIEFAGATGFNGISAGQFNVRYAITVVDANSYTITLPIPATGTGSGGGSAIQFFPECVTVSYDQMYTAANGCLKHGTYQATLAGFGVQDSYGYMNSVSYLTANTIKPVGTEPASLIQRNLGQPLRNIGPTSATSYQAYNSAFPTIFQKLTLSYGQPLRRVSGGVAAWAQNLFARYFWLDNADFGKFYVHLNSSEEGLPRHASLMSTSDVWEWQGTIKTEYNAGGPS